MPNFNNTFKSLPPFLFQEVTPTPLKNPRLIHKTELSEELALNLTSEELRDWLNGQLRLAGEERIATRYAGHQFGVWAGQLGDGRALSLGEIDSAKLGHQEIQTKGSGRTPFSRMGDGKAVIRSSVREYLCSEAMAGLFIPTTRVLALITGEDEVVRESIENSALVARVFPSNLRFGHFELCFHFERDQELQALIDYTLGNFFPKLSLEEMLEEIIHRTARLIAGWQTVGFCHGVMNTDNMSVLGLTIDYGPFGFLEDTVLNYICNHSDHHGRYAYNQQPSIGMWNLERFLVCFMKHIPKEKLEKMLGLYPHLFEQEYLRLNRLKLGLEKEEEKDYELFLELLQLLASLSIDYTFFWRQLSSYQKGQVQSLQEVWNYYGDRKELKAWLLKYDQRLELESLSDFDRSFNMKKTNPKFVLKNYIAQEVIEEVEAGSSQKLEAWLKVLSTPFDEHPGFDSYSLPTPSEKKNFTVSCSS